MYRAFMALEDNQEYVAYNSYWYLYTMMNCCTSLPEVHMGHRFFTQPDAFDGPTISDWKGFITELPDTIVRFQGSIGYLNKALEEMRAALPDVAPHGDYELRYTINRTESYRDYIAARGNIDRKSTRLNSSHGYISYAVFCLKKKKTLLSRYVTVVASYL